MVKTDLIKRGSIKANTMKDEEERIGKEKESDC